MDQQPSETSKHLKESIPKFRYAFPAITNLAIIALFFCTFCQVKSCSGEYKPITGMQLVQRTIESTIRKPAPSLIMSPILITLGSAILSLGFCMGDPRKLDKRTSICGIIGGLSISAFIGFCLVLGGTKLSIAPLLIATLHFSNPLKRYFTGKPNPPPTN